MDDQTNQSLKIKKGQAPPKRGTHGCKFCDFRTRTIIALRNHEILHTKRSQYQCTKCTYSGATRKTVKNHLLNHHLKMYPLIGQQNPGSNHEAEGQASSNAMDANSKSKKEEGFIYIGPHYECEKCNFSTIHIFSMRMHLRGHQRNQLIKCRLCSFSSTNQFVIGRHLNLHHRNASSAAGTDDRSASNSQQVDSLVGIKDNINYSSSDNSDNQHTESTLEDRDPLLNDPPCTSSSFVTANKRADSESDEMDWNAEILPENNDKEVIETIPETSETLKTNPKDDELIECVDLCEDDDDDIEESPHISFARANDAGPMLNQSVQFSGNVKIEESDCRKRISQCREKIRLARISMREMRGKIKVQQDIRSEKKRQKDLLSSRLEALKELTRIRNEKLADLSLKKRKLEEIRINIKNSLLNQQKSELQLRTLQCEVLQSKIAALESTGANEFDISSNLDEVIQPENERIKCFEKKTEELLNELKSLREEEGVIAQNVEQVETSLIGVVPPDNQMLRDIRLELDELESDFKLCLQDNTEELFNQLVLSTEETVRSYFELKNRLFEIMFFKASIRRMTGWKK